MSIVRNSYQLRTYEFNRFEESALQEFRWAVGCMPASAYTQGIESLWKMIECYLEVTSQTLNFDVLNRPDSQKVLEGFLGALTSQELIGLSDITRVAHARIFRWLVDALRTSGRIASDPLGDIGSCRRIWESIPRDEMAIEYWTGWWVPSPRTNDYFLRMGPMWRHVGPECVRSTFSGLTVYWAARANSIRNSSSMFNYVFKFAASQPEFVSINPYSTGVSISRLIRSFCKEFFTDAQKRSLDLTTCKKRWNDWRQVCMAALVEPGIWPTPIPPIPYAPDYMTPGSRTRLTVTANGVEVREKFLTEVPLHLSDEKAIEALLSAIVADKNSVVSWSEERAADLLKRSQRREQLAKEGKDVLVAGRFVGKHLQVSACDYAATFEAHLFALFEEPANFQGVANWNVPSSAHFLGLPTSGELDPFMYLLINEHPQITDAFLRHLKIYDIKGNAIGYIRDDGGCLLIGDKMRKGASLAEQRIRLNQTSDKIIQDVLAITQPLRDWLRAKGDDDWRYLFLSCAKGLSKPSVVKFRAYENDKARHRMLASLASHTARTGADLEAFYDRLSLTSFRASTALTRYFSSGDAQSLTEALGHKKNKPDLLSHYLPESIQLFFKSRSIRQMQNGLVAEALKGSMYLLEATDFSTMEELDLFLEKNAFVRLEEDEIGQSDRTDEEGTVCIDVGEPVLTLLAAINSVAGKTPRRLNKQAKRWAEYSEKLFAEIGRVQHDTRLQARCKRAMEKSESVEVMRLVYE